MIGQYCYQMDEFYVYLDGKIEQNLFIVLI